MAYGTLSVLDTLRAQNNTTVAQFGEDRAFAAISSVLDAHNAILRDELDTLVEFSADRLRRYGAADTMDMIQSDEFGRPDVSKVSAGINVGFPLYLYQGALQWTRKWFQMKTPAELAAQIDAMLAADARRVQNEIKRALYVSTNNLNYTDKLVDGVTLPLRALLNADGTAIPPDPWGNSFSTSHTHYLATASFVASDLTALIDTVTEHNNTGAVRVYINRAQETAVRAFTGFTAYVDMRVTQADTATFANNGLDVMNIYNRAIGIYNGAEIWVKPWVIASYPIAFNTSMPTLVLRTRSGAMGNLELAADNEMYPLRAQFYEREFGVGVWNRANAAVLYIGGGTYTIPTIS